MPERSVPKNSPEERRRGSKRRVERRARLTSTLALRVTAGIGVAVGLLTLATYLQGYNRQPANNPNNTAAWVEGYNSSFRRNPNDASAYAVQIANMAADAFCEDLGCDPNEFRNRIEFQNNEVYRKTYEEGSACKTRLSSYKVAYTNSQNRIYANLDELVYADPSKTRIREDAAQQIFEMSVHEKHHARTKRVPHVAPKVTTKDLIADKGVLSFYVDTQDSKPGQVCERIIRVGLDEAIVQDSTIRVLFKRNIKPAINAYPEHVKVYRDKLIGLFRGDHREPLLIQQSSRPPELSRRVGELLGYASVDQYRYGELHLFNLFDPLT